MESNDRRQRELPDVATEQQIRLEEACKARIEAETKHEMQLERRASRKKIRDDLRKIPSKVMAGIAAMLVVAAVVFFGFVLPIMLDDDKVQYVTNTTLKEAVNIEKLTAIDYVYEGVAEKKSKFLWIDTVDYRVRYEAHVRVNYDMSAIEPEVNEGNKVAVIYLPDAVIEEPVVDPSEFSYLPEDTTADIDEVLALCEEDATAELNRGEMQREALESLKDTVEALTMPLLREDYQLEFRNLSERKGVEGEQNETE